MNSVSLPPSEPDEESFGSVGSPGFDTQMLKDQLMNAIPDVSGTDDTEMLGSMILTCNRLTLTAHIDMETQMPSYPNEDPIESFQTQGGAQAQEDRIEVTDKGLQCECGVDVSSFLTNLFTALSSAHRAKNVTVVIVRTVVDGITFGTSPRFLALLILLIRRL